MTSRSQTSTGAMVPIKATARSRNTPLASFCACSPKLAGQQLADRVGIADGKGIEAMAVFSAARHHQIEHAHVILAAKSPRQAHHLAEQIPVAFAIDQDKAGAAR